MIAVNKSQQRTATHKRRSCLRGGIELSAAQHRPPRQEKTAGAKKAVIAPHKATKMLEEIMLLVESRLLSVATNATHTSSALRPKKKRQAFAMRATSVGRRASTRVGVPRNAAPRKHGKGPAAASGLPKNTNTNGDQPTRQSTHPTSAIVPLTRWRSCTDASSASASKVFAERLDDSVSSDCALGELSCTVRRVRRARPRERHHGMRTGSTLRSGRAIPNQMPVKRFLGAM